MNMSKISLERSDLSELRQDVKNRLSDDEDNRKIVRDMLSLQKGEIDMLERVRRLSLISGYLLKGKNIDVNLVWQKADKEFKVFRDFFEELEDFFNGSVPLEDRIKTGEEDGFSRKDLMRENPNPMKLKEISREDNHRVLGTEIRDKVYYIHQDESLFKNLPFDVDDGLEEEIYLLYSLLDISNYYGWDMIELLSSLDDEDAPEELISAIKKELKNTENDFLFDMESEFWFLAINKMEAPDDMKTGPYDLDEEEMASAIRNIEDTVMSMLPETLVM